MVEAGVAPSSRAGSEANSWPHAQMAADAGLFELTRRLMARYDLDKDGLLNAEEVRALFRDASGLCSKDRRNPAGFDHKTFRTLCSDPGGLSPAELFQLLAHSDGALGRALDAATRVAATQTQSAEKHSETDLFVSLPAPERLALNEQRPGALGRALMASADGDARSGTGGAPSSQEGSGSCGDIRKVAPRLSGLSDALNVAKLSELIRQRNHQEVADLLNRQHVLWSHPNPEVLDIGLQRLLQTNTARFPLLFVAAFSSDIRILRILAQHIRQHGDLEGAIGTEVEGWSLAAIIGLPAKSSAAKDRHNLMLCFMDLGGLSAHYSHVMHRCLLQSGSIAPLELAVWKGMSAAEVNDWCSLVTLIVKHSGFPHEDPWESMAKLGTHLAYCEIFCDFLNACANAGDSPRPGSPAFAGLFLGLLDEKVGARSALVALEAIVNAGLELKSPLSFPTGGLMPLHAAARHDRPHIAMSLLALRADLVAKDSRGRTALDVAQAGRSGRTVAVLRKAARAPPHWDSVLQSIRIDEEQMIGAAMVGAAVS